MEVPKDLDDARTELETAGFHIGRARELTSYARSKELIYEEFADQWNSMNPEIVDASIKVEEAVKKLDALRNAIKQTEQFTKDFDLYPGDRVAISMPAQGGFPAGYSEGTVIKADWWGPRDGWYIEQNKDYATAGWQTGYGYWKQGMDGGEVRQL